MIELQRNFLAGVMNKDLDPHYLPDGTYQDALNIIVGDSDGSFDETQGTHNGVAQNYLGNILKGFDLELINATCIGSLAYDTNNVIYWLVASDTLDAVYEYNEITDTITPVLRASKLTPTTPSLLGFNKEFFVTGINYINGLLFWTDNLNPPRRINVDRCKNYSIDGFTDADINVILAPPLKAPTVELYNSGESNNLENKFLYFAYRYKYLDNEYSALSPFSPVAFFPKDFQYDYGISENVSMTNKYNSAIITFNSGLQNVKEIQLVFRDTSSANTYIVDNLVKSTLGYNDDTEYPYQFKNNKVYTVLPSGQVERLFDNVPIRAKSQELIGSRLIYGNYTQFFNLTTCDKQPINPRFTLSIDPESAEITDGVPRPTFKSNRDYEIGIVYTDDYGRSSTVVVPSENTNTVFIPASRSNWENNIRVVINKDYEAPCFASNYRFVIKQNKQDYYNLFPLVYFNDGQFRWFLINQADQDKISVGSYLYLKSLSPNNDIQYKVLDIESKSADFLNNSEKQPAGVYFKIKIPNSALPPVNQYNSINVSPPTGTGPAFKADPIRDRFTVAENTIFYGSGLNDATTGDSNVFTGSDDVRFYIEIDSVGTVDTFKCMASADGLYQVDVFANEPITPGVDQELTYLGKTCYINFASATGHTMRDYWVINCRSFTGKNIFGGPTYDATQDTPATFATGVDWNLTSSYNSDRPIKAGAVLTFKSIEHENGNVITTQLFVATRDYVNIEEWFIEDEVYSKWNWYFGATNVGPYVVCFRRAHDFNRNSVTLVEYASQGSSISTASLEYPVYMFILGMKVANTLNNYLEVSLNIVQQDSPTLFETVPEDTNQDIYYELSKTFPIINGAHAGNNQDQVIGVDPAIIDLNKSYPAYPNRDFNAFSFGNGVESYRIRDDWNAAYMQYSPRANSTVEGYEEQTLVQALTYSGIYTQTSAINGLNEFNLSLANFKYLDRFFGSIQKLFSRDTDLVVFQENKVSKVLYGKNLLSDSVGGGAIASVPEVLGTQISYEGEYGISLNPESFARWGNNLYFTDARRGAVMALQSNGLFEISSEGMKNWFKANLDTNTVKLGMFDPYFEHYVLTADNSRKIKTCSLSVTPTSLSFTGTAQSKTFYIESNVDWEIQVPTNSWLTVSDKFGSNNELITVTVDVNESEERELDITIISCADPVVLNVIQTTVPTVYDWYELINCDTLATAYSVQYPENSFELNERVTNDGATYTVSGILHSEPVGTLLDIVTTGESGCPGGTTYLVNIYGKRTLGSARVLYYGINDPLAPLGGDVLMTTGGELMYSFIVNDSDYITIQTAYSATEAIVKHSSSTISYDTDYAYCTNDIVITGNTNIYIVADIEEC